MTEAPPGRPFRATVPTSRALPAAAPLLPAAVLAAVLAAAPARATSPTLFGVGARSAGLVQSDVADADPFTAASTNPAFLWRPGTRVLFGHGYAAVRFEIDGRDSTLRDITGTDLAGQIGFALSDDVTLGGGITIHWPAATVAKLTFRRATEPQLPLYEVSPHRTTSDQALALRVGRLAVGLGASIVARSRGDGIHVDLTQDAEGTNADASAAIEVPYSVSPLAGLALDLDRLALAAKLRFPTELELESTTTTFVDIPGSPLNGTTVVELSGKTGYEPLYVDLGVRGDLTDRLRALASLQYARWSAAPPPDARVELDLQLGSTPQQIEVIFPYPRFRDTLSPRLGVEVRAIERDESRGKRDERPALAVRGGWSVVPSPVPSQTGFTSYADATRHVWTVGTGVHFGRPWGVELTGDVALGYHRLNERKFVKPSDALPNARYRVGGDMLYAAASIGGAWR